jgi:hypothetical protein
LSAPIFGPDYERLGARDGKSFLFGGSEQHKHIINEGTNPPQEAFENNTRSTTQNRR